MIPAFSHHLLASSPFFSLLLSLPFSFLLASPRFSTLLSPSPAFFSLLLASPSFMIAVFKLPSIPFFPFCLLSSSLQPIPVSLPPPSPTRAVSCQVRALEASLEEQRRMADLTKREARALAEHNCALQACLLLSLPPIPPFRTLWRDLLPSPPLPSLPLPPLPPPSPQLLPLPPFLSDSVPDLSIPPCVQERVEQTNAEYRRAQQEKEDLLEVSQAHRSPLSLQPHDARATLPLASTRSPPPSPH